MRNSVKMVLLAAAMLTSCSAWVYAQDAATDTRKAQNKLLALRAARVDGMRKLAEMIYGLHITSKTTVKDFVTESDSIQTAMNAFLTGVREKEGSVKYIDDGSCEITMEVTLETVITTLKEFSTRYYKGDKFKATDFSEMTQTNEKKVISVVGNGAPRPAAWERGETVGATVSVAKGLPDGMSEAAWAFWKEKVTAQPRLMAVQGARTDAQRKLAERINGLYISSNTQVKDFITESDEIKTVSTSMLKGARMAGIKYHNDEPIVEVTMEVTLQTIYETVKTDYEAKYKGDKVKIKDFEERIQHAENKVLSETGMAVAAMPDTPAIVTEVAAVSHKWPAAIRAAGNAAIDQTNENKAQAKLMAFRGAELDARRKLSEEISGLMIDSKTKVKDFITESDTIRTAMLDFQQGARVIDESKKELGDGSVEISVEIDPEPLWDIVLKYHKVTVTKGTD